MAELTPLEAAIDRHTQGKGGLWDITPSGDAEIERLCLEQISAGQGEFKTRGNLSLRQSANARAINRLFERGLIRLVSKNKRATSTFALTPRGQTALSAQQTNRT